MQPEPSLSAVGWNFDNTYTRLPETFFQTAQPATARAPRLVALNHSLAEELGLSLNDLPEETLAALFSGQQLPPGAEPIAQAYAGHQFGGFTMLGDGRALLLGEQQTPTGKRFDIQFKGSGPTPYSRRGDGLAGLGPMLREHIIGEAMHALGVPTTRSLAVVATGEPVRREQMQQGAVLTRVAASHLRVGTFQYAAARQESEDLQTLADYAIQRHFPELAETPQKYWEFLKAVVQRQASLIAQWQLIGFIHGVMNTDNMAIGGETIDYGPCAFMDVYHPETVFSSIDHNGRYAYNNQPAIGQWNLARFAETLLPLLDENEEQAIERAMEILNEYPEFFQQAWRAGMRKKLGLQTEADGDGELIEQLLNWMLAAEVDFTNTFDDLSSAETFTGDAYQDERFRTWLAGWRKRVESEGQTMAAARASMQAVNPAVIPRNHRVEEALAAAEQGDLSVMHKLLEVLASPYQREEAQADYRVPPPPGTCYQTFCGT